MISFIDTNVFVYSIDASQPAKQASALECIARARDAGTVALSTQVLCEFYNISTLKLRPAATARQAAAYVADLCEFHVVGSDTSSVRSALALAQQHRLQWWDALILEAAIRSGADVLLTEDGQHGQRFGKLTVQNPFAAG